MVPILSKLSSLDSWFVDDSWLRQKLGILVSTKNPLAQLTFAFVRNFCVSSILQFFRLKLLL